jgi:hypothetical protein
MSIIPNKEASYKLFEAGRFGNKPQTWPSLDELIASGFNGLVALRYKEPGSRFCRIGMTLQQLIQQRETWISEGADPKKFTFIDGSLENIRQFQGEIQRSERYYDLTYTLEDGPMRVALAKQTLHATGLKAYGLMKKYMDPADFDWMQELFDEWPTAVIEFTCFQKTSGSCRRRAHIWEVRDY